MRIVALCLLALASVSRAEPSLLERLSDEMRRIVADAEGALVELSASLLSVEPVVASRNSGHYLITPGLVLPGANARAVRLGGKYLALPASVAAAGRTVTVRMGGEDVSATVAFSDADLGIAIATLPAGAGLVPEKEWRKVQPGTLAVAIGDGPSLRMISSCSRAAARLEVEGAPGEAVALVGADGALLGLRMSGAGRFVVGREAPASAPEAARLFWRATAAWERARAQLVYTTAAGTGSGFLPGPLIHRLLADLDEHGRVRRAFVGVVAGDVQGKGVVLSQVLAGSPADRAGLKARDLVVSINGESCGSASGLSRLLAGMRAGEVAAFLLGDGRRVDVTTEDRATAEAAPASAEALGLDCVDLTPDLRRWLGLDAATQGVLVQSVEAGSPAEAAGIRRGDLIRMGGEGKVATLEELNAAVGGAKGSLPLTLLRDSTSIATVVRLPPTRLASSPR